MHPGIKFNDILQVKSFATTTLLHTKRFDGWGMSLLVEKLLNLLYTHTTFVSF